uniref:hypothetical protein n=1 Tax=Nonomuraea sp. CA-251285 TaxID=3240002 RepID=UPI003F494273
MTTAPCPPQITIHRTTSIPVLAQYHDHLARQREWQTRLADWARRQRIAPRPVLRHGDIAGFAHTPGTPVPTGWRLSNETPALLVPYIRTRAGRDLARDLGSLLPPRDIRPLLPGIACPAITLMTRRLSHFALELHEGGTALYAVWDGHVGDSAGTPPTWETVDPGDYSALCRRERAA